MKVCPNCQTKYQDDANFCPQETCATPEGPRRLDLIAPAPPPHVPPARYQLEERIGGARSGEVWRARDNQSGTAVAYKVVAKASLPTGATVERALRELKQLQRALNPHLARVLDFGKDAEGRLYVVTEICEGLPLDRVVASAGPLPLDRAKKIVAQIGEALLEGQKVGVVHHDLSAKNILVGADDDNIKVINFVVPVAVTETVFGVAEYLSPEQAEGKLVDQRSNTYSLGAVATLMLTGQAPVIGADSAAVLQQVLKGELVPPSRNAVGLTPEIDRVILKAMDKSPNRRPLTMRQFLTDVSALVGLGGSAGADRAAVGFAKTMMFTGGTTPPEVQKLVNQAMAARAQAGANGAQATMTPPIAVVASEQVTPPPQPAAVVGRAAMDATPPPAPAAANVDDATPLPDPAQLETPPPQMAPAAPAPRRSHGAAIAATMVALPAAGARMPGAGAPRAGAAQAAALDAEAQATPPPVAGGAPTPKQAAGGTFRETLWFKKGDVDQMVAEARARVQAARGKDEPEAATTPEDARPLEDRYVDDGSVTVEDRKNFSLRSGGTATALPTVGSIPGERMTEAEMVGEIGGRKRTIIIVGVIAVVLAVGAVVALGFRKNLARSASAIAPTTTAAPAEPAPAAAPVPPPPPPAAPAEPAPAAKPAAPTPPAPAAAAAAAEPSDDDEAPAAPATKSHAAHKHAGKKAKGGKKHH